MAREIISPTQKALTINLEPKIYGTFAEIGAGQEVVRTFFRAGGAAGTIAKSMSAYDMQFSDAIYGPEESGRYVCENRVKKMLDKEYSLIDKRLGEVKALESTFFVFADTVAARSFKNQKKEGHGWLGIKFQTRPKSAPNSIHVHVRMKDRENVAQQIAIGVIGTNLIYGAFYHWQEPEILLDSLMDNATNDHIEIDMIKFFGPDFAKVDNRLMALQLIKQKHTDAIIFSPEGEVLLPQEVLYKRPVLVQRGSFRPPTHVNIDMSDCAHRKFIEEPAVVAKKDQVVLLKEITMNNLTAEGSLDSQDFLDRVDLLGSLGNNVLVSTYFEYYRLTNFLGRCTNEFIGVTLGMVELKQLFDEAHYSFLDGGLLEAFGKLLNRPIRMYVYPSKDHTTGKIQTAESFITEKHLQPLYQFLVQNDWIVPLKGFHEEYLGIFSKEVLKQLQTGGKGWETQVPDIVAETVKSKGLFGFKKKVG